MIYDVILEDRNIGNTGTKYGDSVNNTAEFVQDDKIASLETLVLKIQFISDTLINVQHFWRIDFQVLAGNWGSLRILESASQQ